VSTYLDFEAPSRLRLKGAWSLEHAEAIRRELAQMDPRRVGGGTTLVLDGGALERLDSAGALLLVRLAERIGTPLESLQLDGAGAGRSALLERVARQVLERRQPKRRSLGFRELTARVGRKVEDIWLLGRGLLGFFGLALATLGATLLRPRRLRLTATVHHMEQTGLDAVPLVALLSFLVGAVVAFLGATVLRDFAAEVFTVELVSFAFLREFGVLLTAILLAGRTASAFTAQIGAMKSHEEIDAIRTLGLDPIELLVVPRMIALLVMLPLLAFIAMLAGILGGGVVAVLSLDMSPAMFVARFVDTMELRHLWVGLIKAPVFALVIAVIGCLEGFRVEGSAESVGEHTTSAVVQAIFLVILIDAIFAVFFMEIGL
jgi:phospholipid/cholesterol/gamma-HCH transport system permease protein